MFAKCFRSKRRKEISERRPLTPAASRSEMIVDEEGLDVIYWRQLKNNRGFQKERFDRSSNGKIANLPPSGRSPSSHRQIHPGRRPDNRSSGVSLHSIADSGGGAGGGGQPSSAVQTPPTPAPPPPPAPAPPPPPAPAPPPPPVPAKKPPPPPAKPPAAPKPPSGGSKTAEAEVSSGIEQDQVMLRPLHWEKLNVNADHSMVWDKIDKGSFRYNTDAMEALFGFAPSNAKPLEEEKPKAKIIKPSNANAKIFILDPRKSQNTAIVLKSLGIPRGELIDSLLEGKGLSVETLEKLARIAPMKDEQSKIMAFDGDPSRLADAESMLYNVLKEVPSAFARANAMLFRMNYDSEVMNIKESLHTMESACNELRGSGIFTKLLEAVLKAGNRLNAGTARGDAKGFSLSTLLKLSDFKGSDGKTTLLQFVIREVVKKEGKRILETADSSSGSSSDSDSEFLKAGLPVVSGLGCEFSTVKKSASIDYNAFKSAISALESRASGSNSEFVMDKEEFVKSAAIEIKAIQDEHTRVIELVKKTTNYYQSDASYKNPLQLFIIVKDFLGMVEQACAAMGRSLQSKKVVTAVGSSQPEVVRSNMGFPKLPDNLLKVKVDANSESQPGVVRSNVAFPKLPDHLLKGKVGASSDSDSDEDF